MRIISTLYRWLTGNSTAQQTGTQSTQPASSAYDDMPVVGPDSALQVSTVWACVTLLVDTIASLPLFLYGRNSNGNRVAVPSESLYMILHDRPNKRHTAYEFWSFMVLHYVLRGNAYARIDRNTRGDVVALWPLSADQMEVRLLDDGSLVYLYSYSNKTLIYAEADILHIRGMGNGVVGMSPLDYMRASIGLAISAQNHTNKTYRKEARRPGILMSENVLTDSQRAKLKENFSEIVTGGQRELFILEADFKFEPLGMTPADLQLIETRAFSVEDLARWFGVPSVLINDTNKTTVWGTGVGQIMDGFYKTSIRAHLECIEQVLNLRLLTPAQRAKGFMAEFNFDAILRASLKDRMELYARAVQNGIKSRNECRALENDPPYEGGDIMTAQSNLYPIDKLGTQPAQNGEPPEETVEQ